VSARRKLCRRRRKGKKMSQDHKRWKNVSIKAGKLVKHKSIKIQIVDDKVFSSFLEEGKLETVRQVIFTEKTTDAFFTIQSLTVTGVELMIYKSVRNLYDVCRVQNHRRKRNFFTRMKNKIENFYCMSLIAALLQPLNIIY
jgi:hypothetical protein